MSHLTVPKSWERKKYEKRSEDSLTLKDLDVSDDGPLMVKISQQIADFALLTLQVSHTVFDRWTVMYTTIHSLQDGTQGECIQSCYDFGLENGSMLLAR